MLRVNLTTFFTILVFLILQNEELKSTANYVDGSIGKPQFQFRISARVAESVCGQRREYAKTRRLQPPLRASPKSAEESLNACLSYMKLEGGNFGLRIVCTPSQAMKIGDPRLRKFGRSSQSLGKKGGRKKDGVCHLIDNEPDDSITDPDDGSSGRSGVRRPSSRLWRFNDDCYIPFFYAYCLRPDSPRHDCETLTRFREMLTFLGLLLPNLVLDFFNQPDPPTVLGAWVDVVPEGGCSAYVGRRFGNQTLRLGPTCDTDEIVLHEISHILGVRHEQQRFDRDTYIEVFPENIDPDFKTDFVKDNPKYWDTYMLPYNQNSNMHYKEFDGSKYLDAPTMKPRRGGTLGLGGIHDEGDQDLRLKLYGDCKL